MQFGLPLYDALCARGRSASVAHIAHGAAAAGLRLHAFDAELGASRAIVHGMNAGDWAAAGEDMGAEAGQSATAFANEMAREALLWETAEIEAICAGFSKVCVRERGGGGGGPLCFPSSHLDVYRVLTHSLSLLYV